MSTHKVSQREMDDHIFHRETLEKMIHYYQILIYTNTKAIEDFNKLYEKLAPIKEEIVAKEFEDFDLEEKKSPVKTSKKKGKKKK